VLSVLCFAVFLFLPSERKPQQHCSLDYIFVLLVNAIDNHIPASVSESGLFHSVASAELSANKSIAGLLSNGSDI